MCGNCCSVDWREASSVAVAVLVQTVSRLEKWPTEKKKNVNAQGVTQGRGMGCAWVHFKITNTLVS